jgi:hypothetical protein
MPTNAKIYAKIEENINNQLCGLSCGRKRATRSQEWDFGAAGSALFSIFERN